MSRGIYASIAHGAISYRGYMRSRCDGGSQAPRCGTTSEASRVSVRILCTLI